MLSSSRRRRADDESSYGITTAEGSHLDDISRRQRQYVVTMVFRIVAIMVVVFVPGLTLLERVVLGIVATVIPYFAVIRANAGPDHAADPTNLMIGGPRQGALPGPDRGLDGGPRHVDVDVDFDTDEDTGTGGSGGGGGHPDPARGGGDEGDETREGVEIITGYVVYDDAPREAEPGGPRPAAEAADHFGHSDPDTP